MHADYPSGVPHFQALPRLSHAKSAVPRQIDHSLPHPFIHPSNNSDVEYLSIPHIALPGSAPIHPGSTNLHMLLPIAYTVLLSPSNWCSIASTASNRHIPSNIHSESPHRHPQHVAPCPTNHRSHHASLYGADLPFAHNRRSAIQRKFDVIWLLFPEGLVDIAIELREPSYTLLVDDKG